MSKPNLQIEIVEENLEDKVKWVNDTKEVVQATESEYEEEESEDSQEQ